MRSNVHRGRTAWRRVNWSRPSLTDLAYPTPLSGARSQGSPALVLPLYAERSYALGTKVEPLRVTSSFDGKLQGEAMKPA